MQSFRVTTAGQKKQIYIMQVCAIPIPIQIYNPEHVDFTSV